MSALSIQPTFPIFTETDGLPLENGYIWIGTANLDPQGNPINVYWDAALTIAAPQPIRTINGYPSRNGTPGRLYVNSDYSIRVQNSKGSLVYSAPEATERISSNLVSFQQAGTGAVIRDAQGKMRESFSILDFIPSGTDTSAVDCTAYIQAAINAAYANSLALYIPGKPPGEYYRITGQLEIIGKDSFTLYGDGVSSLLFQAGAANGIVVDDSTHVLIENIGMQGGSTSLDGLVLQNASHRARINNCWFGWFGGKTINHVQAISCKYTNVLVDTNDGYRPAGSNYGNPTYSIFVAADPSGLNNDINFINCSVDGGASQYALSVGGGGLPLGDQPVEGFKWIGGLVQGGTKVVYLGGVTDGYMSGCYVEPSTIDPTNSFYMINCRNVLIEGGTIICPINMNNGAQDGCVVQNVRIYGVTISTTSNNCVVRDCIQHGGQIISYSKSTKIENITKFTAYVNRRDEQQGDSLNMAKSLYFGTDFTNWIAPSGTPSVPCGFTKQGAGTVNQVGSTSPVGTYAVQNISASDNTEGIKINVAPVGVIAGKKIYVETLAYSNVGAEAYIVVRIDGGATIISQQSNLTDQWERMRASFTIPAAATTVEVMLTNQSGTAYFADFFLWIEDFAPQTWGVLDGTATPSVSYASSYPLKMLRTSGTPTITNFLHPHTGVPFTLYFDGATIIQNNANIKLAGAANFTGSADDTLTLVYASDGVFREVSRSVN